MILREQKNAEANDLLGKRSNHSKDNISVVKTPSSVSVVKISLKSSTTDQLEPKGWWCWPFLTPVTLTNESLDSVDHPIPFMYMHVLLA